MSKQRTSIHRAASRVHKWLALFIGIQVLIWFASGTVMSFLPIQGVRGEHLVEKNLVTALPRGMPLGAPTMIVEASQTPVQSITWRMAGGRAVAEVTTTKGVKLFDVATNQIMPPITADQATMIARKAWKSDPVPASRSSRVTSESPEYRGALPAWRIAFSDDDATSVFVAADTGRIEAVRTATWRFYDFFWSLHIMDWKNHENFNTPWLLGFAIGGLIFGISGTILLIMRWPVSRERQGIS